MYDFPTSPNQGDVFSAGAAKWTWNGYAWVGGPAASTGGSGGGTPFPEAPVDGQQYGRQSAAWSVIVIPAGDWASITGKPATFPGDWNTTINKPAEFPSSWTLVTGKPSTYPSDWNTTANKPSSMTPTAHTHDFGTGVTGKPGTYPPTLPIDYATGISGKPATFPPDLPIGWTSISGKPATYPPTLPITITDVTALQGQLDALNTAVTARVAKAGDTMTGPLNLPTGAVSATSINFGTAGTGLYGLSSTGVKIATGGADRLTIASTGITSTLAITLPADPTTALQAATKQYVDAKTGGAIASVSDTAPSSPANGQLWWNSFNGKLYIWFVDGTSNQWVQVNN